MKFDVITIGSAVRDVFVKSEGISVLRNNKFPTGKGLAMPLGSKIDVDEIHFEIGGGAVNTAATFGNQKLKTAILTVVGKDAQGEAIRSRLKEKRVSDAFLFQDKQDATAYSTILTEGKAGRTVLRYSGVEWELHNMKIPWKKIGETKWFYINHIGGKSKSLLPKIFEVAEQYGIKIAWNPGSTQLAQGKRLKPFLAKTDLLFLNQEEAAQLTGLPYRDTQNIFRTFDEWVRGVAVMTKGPKGVEVSDGKTVWSAGVLPLKNIKDRTGAGDAFGSGFTAAYIKKPKDIEGAIQFASANATGVLTEWGTTNGLLLKNDSLKKWGTLKISHKTL